jgi:hypothetical protein
VGFVVDKEALDQLSFQYFYFPCKSFIPPIAPQSSPSIIRGWYNRPFRGISNSGLGSTPAKQIKNNSDILKQLQNK